MQQLMLKFAQVSGVIAVILLLKNLVVSLSSTTSTKKTSSMEDSKSQSVLTLLLRDTAIWNFFAVGNCITKASYGFEGSPEMMTTPGHTAKVIAEIVKWNSGEDLNTSSGFKIVAATLVSVTGHGYPSPVRQPMTTAEAVEHLKLKYCGDFNVPKENKTELYNPHSEMSFSLDLVLEDGSGLEFVIRNSVIQNVNYKLGNTNPIPFNTLDFGYLRRELIAGNVLGNETAPLSFRIKSARVETISGLVPITNAEAINILKQSKLE